MDLEEYIPNGSGVDPVRKTIRWFTLSASGIVSRYLLTSMASGTWGNLPAAMTPKGEDMGMRTGQRIVDRGSNGLMMSVGEWMPPDVSLLHQLLNLIL